MWTVAAAIAALVCFLLAFILELTGGGVGINLVVLGWVFAAVWMLVTSLPARTVR